MYNIVDIHKENTYLKELHTKTSINRVLIFRKAKEFFEADKANCRITLEYVAPIRIVRKC